jgi:hypothetical protein
MKFLTYFSDKAKLRKINKFLNEIKDISIGYGEINFIQFEDLDKNQIGYKIDTKGNSLVTEVPGSWRNDWLVIGHDNVGDPIFIEKDDEDLPIYTSEHGKEEWEVVLIAESLEKFKTILEDLRKLSIQRENPDKLEENPLIEKDSIEFIKKIKKKNKDVDFWWWELFLDNNTGE